jgi:hypothetical protein
MHRTILALALAALTTPAFANGAMTEFAGGGLVFKQATDIMIEREDLFLSLDKVTVHYDYNSFDDATEHATIGFPMPPVPIDGGPDDPSSLPDLEGKDVLNYMQFSASVNGAPVETNLHQFAWLGGDNITARLERLGVPVYLPYDQIDAVFAKLEPSVVDGMEADGMISRDPEHTYIVPNWSYQSVYEWEQDFAPGLTQVDIAYVPLAGYPGDFGDRYENDPVGVFCLDDKLLQTIKDYRDKGISYEIGTLGYITTTAQYWNGAIGAFNLTVAKEPLNAEYSIVHTETAFCRKPAAIESDTDFKWTATDYVPRRDIEIVYYSFYDYGGDEESAE